MDGSSGVLEFLATKEGGKSPENLPNPGGLRYGPKDDFSVDCAETPQIPATFWRVRGKRAFDLAFSAAFLGTVGIWLIPIIGAAIKLDSPGPVFFRQRRTGLNGQTFTCLKFRTMRHSPGEGFKQAKQNDHRVTRVGRFLRKTNLDEIPQFINVLLGDMSVVGPRPHVPELDAKFSSYVPGYAQRHLIKPGVTGLAQVSGCRGETRSVREMRNRVRFDCFYLRNAAFGLDMRIVFWTVSTMLGGDDRAY
ncbi:sugar transferase [Sinimarinibacterium sp. CAU 1509]|uniref:sugar transferase n=1 Tax=Sinimarinibacterium sp. CAU 1509 TaxID=2562283 RepID=UPI00146ED7BB|nr:sugar transferase [Sinimarinibacterium sp. CAU 1509]